MATYNFNDYREETATFIHCENGYYTFELQNNEEIVFEEINRAVLKQLDLKDKALTGKAFTIGFREIIEDDEDLVVFRLEKIKRA